MAKGVNNTDLNGCTCFQNPPCSYCVDTFDCAMCDCREYSDGSIDTEIGFVCEGCAETLEL